MVSSEKLLLMIVRKKMFEKQQTVDEGTPPRPSLSDFAEELSGSVLLPVCILTCDSISRNNP